MDLTADQFERIKKFINDWSKDTKFELETTFGSGGIVDSNTFLQIAQRLRTKGFEDIPQEDYLNIITPKHIRFTLQGLGILQSYCKDDSMNDKVFSAMFKDRAFADSNLDINEYDIRFKVRREEGLSNDDPRVTDLVRTWATQKKAFRLIRRWSFLGKGIRVDLSMVRQSPKVPGKSEYIMSTTFLENNVLNEVPQYEVEVELLHHTDYTDTPEKALRALISGVGEVQRAIQKNSLLIRKSITNSVRNEYQQLTSTEKFRGVGPVTIQVKNIIPEMDEAIPNVRTGYNVTDKADGLRAMGFVNKSGELFLIDQSMNVYRTGLKNKACASSLVDGEWVTMSNDNRAINHYLLFDIYYHMDGKIVSQLPFATFKDGLIDPASESRYNHLKDWNEKWRLDIEVIAKGVTDSSRLIVALKHFEFGIAGNDSIFKRGCSTILDTSRIYHTDGLILTSNLQTIPEKPGVRFEQQFKWKPSKDNTIDFLINFEKDPSIPSVDKVTTTIHPSSESTIQFKTMRLYVGGSKSSVDENPRAAILFEEMIGKEKDENRRYRPILFNPVDFQDTMANTCNIVIETNPETLEEYVMTEDSKEPITDKSIVEMRYDPAREPGWRWIPSRIRHDKTERLLRAIARGGTIKYSGMMNDEGVANSVWNSIHDPVTESMIRSGNEEPSESEIKNLQKVRESDISRKYYERKAPMQNMALIKGLQDFHNKYIKNEILLKRTLAGGNKMVLDVACGKAGDLYKWKFNNAKYVVGIDYAGDNITNPNDGAYKRYIELIREFGPNRVPKIAFAIGNSSKNIVDGSAGANTEERDILRTIFGRVAPEGFVPKYIEHSMNGLYRDGADVVACMFALHYFFESKTSLDGFIKNLADTVKIGGYFVGCCFDGDRIFNLLRGVELGHSRSGQEGDVPIWTITKKYEKDDLVPDETSVGLGIDVEFISIGSKHTEYLVSFDYFKQRLAEIGLHLLSRNESDALHLVNSTATFDISYAMVEKEQSKESGKKKFSMTDSVKEFSFLNRWFIFKRRDTISEEESKIEEELEEKSAEDIKHFGKEIVKYNKTGEYAKYATVPSSEYSVLKPWQKPQVRDILLKWFPNPSDIKTIVDATAHIGVDTIHLSTIFSRATIDAFEIVPATYQALVMNIRKFGKENQIKPHNEDVTKWTPSYAIDLLYVDPPWEGVKYAEAESMDLYLQKEGNTHNNTKNINQLIDKWINSQKIHHIILKAPSNFNKTYLAGTYSLQEEVVLNRAKKVAYTLIHIQSPHDAFEEKPKESMAESVKVPEKIAISEIGDEKVDESYALPQLDMKFADSDLIRFGTGAIAIKDGLGLRTSGGKPDIHIARWLAPSAPFPIPDPDLTAPDGTPIMYPSVEHYVSAMKLRYSTNKDQSDANTLAIHRLSTLGTIHQLYNTIRQREKVQPDSERDFALLKDEANDVRKLVNKKGELNKARVVFDDQKWNEIKDTVLMDALTHRWTRDARFKNAVEAARQRNKYLLYSIKSENAIEASSALELGGTRDVRSGQIKGENKMGRFIMQIAGFRF